MRRLALCLLVVPIYLIGFVLFTDGVDADYAYAGHVLSGWQVLVAAWGTALVLVVFSHSVWIDLLGKRRVLAPAATFVGIGCLVVVLAMVSMSGPMLDWLRLR